MFKISCDFIAQHYYLLPSFNLLVHKTHTCFSPNFWRTVSLSLPDLPIGNLVYILQVGDWAVVPVSQEGETVGKRNVLDYYIFSTESS
jgi:hypothetical protein